MYLFLVSERYQAKTATKVALPGTADADDAPHELREETAEFWLLETLKLVIEAAGCVANFSQPATMT